MVRANQIEVVLHDMLAENLYRLMLKFNNKTSIGIRACVGTLRWRNNGRDGVSNHQPHDVYATVYSDADKKIKAPRHWPLYGKSTGAGDFPAQMTSYAENISISWPHHELHSHELVGCNYSSATYLQDKVRLGNATLYKTIEEII